MGPTRACPPWERRPRTTPRGGGENGGGWKGRGRRKGGWIRTRRIRENNNKTNKNRNKNKNT
uniref:Uncharacterized protein n=1 Tax=Human herpesvirus 2 TaxID=10310 RepID=A0A481TMD5_HHV2|nr:hypothetical protein [Human alphaherpesvirus 2]